MKLVTCFGFDITSKAEDLDPQQPSVSTLVFEETLTCAYQKTYVEMFFEMTSLNSNSLIY